MNKLTPRYEYSRYVIKQKVHELLGIKCPFGFCVRYAVKANPHTEIVSIMNRSGIHFDASSSYEAVYLIEQGVEAGKISLSSQQAPHNFDYLLDKGILFVATSLKQLELFLAEPSHPLRVGVRINPDFNLGGHNKRTSTGGVNASFGIWHEYIPQVLEMVSKCGVLVDRLHIHVGSGSDPDIWGQVMDVALEVVEKMPDVNILDIGGGYKVHRYGSEGETNMKQVGAVFSEKLNNFANKTGRQISLEIEPGTYLVAHAGVLVATVDDIVDTGKNGYTFLRLNTGMNDFLRSVMYGARHKIEVINDAEEKIPYVVVGHNCESGDIFTPVENDPESIDTIMLSKAGIGDEVRIYDVGAYCASMRARGYNSFPDATEVMVD